MEVRILYGCLFRCKFNNIQVQRPKIDKFQMIYISTSENGYLKLCTFLQLDYIYLSRFDGDIHHQRTYKFHNLNLSLRVNIVNGCFLLRREVQTATLHILLPDNNYRLVSYTRKITTRFECHAQFLQPYLITLIRMGTTFSFHITTCIQ